MDIILDGQPLDVTLESERSLSDIIKALAVWIDSQGGIILELRIDDKPFDSAASAEWENIPLEKINRIELRTESRQSYNLKELHILLDYFSIMEKAFSAGDISSLKKIYEEYSYLRETLLHHLRDVLGPLAGGTATILDHVSSVLASSSVTELPEDVIQNALDYLRSLKIILSSRMNEITDPEKETETTIKLLRQSKVDIEQVSILLQTGKDGEAMQRILAYTECVLKSIRLLSLSPRSPEVDSFCNEMNSILRELAEAFSLKDSVLIGDLLEYELAPRIDRLADFLSARLRQGDY